MATIGLPSRVAQPLRILQRLQGPLSVWRRTFLPALATLPLLGDARISSPPFTLPNSLSSMLASLLELFPSIVLAVPKSKVSHSRKSMRSANKGLHDKLSEHLLPFVLLAYNYCQDALHFLPSMHPPSLSPSECLMIHLLNDASMHLSRYCLLCWVWQAKALTQPMPELLLPNIANIQAGHSPGESRARAGACCYANRRLGEMDWVG